MTAIRPLLETTGVAKCSKTQLKPKRLSQVDQRASQSHHHWHGCGACSPNSGDPASARSAATDNRTRSTLPNPTGAAVADNHPWLEPTVGVLTAGTATRGGRSLTNFEVLREPPHSKSSKSDEGLFGERLHLVSSLIVSAHEGFRRDLDWVKDQDGPISVQHLNDQLGNTSDGPEEVLGEKSSHLHVAFLRRE